MQHDLRCLRGEHVQLLNRSLSRGLRGAGQDAIAAANQITTDRAKWPYRWLQPGPDAQYKQPVASIPAPALLNFQQTEVLSLTVPAGFIFVLRAILQTYQTNSGSIFVNGSGDILWTVDVNIPVGIPTLGGYALPDLSNMAEQRGSFADKPWYLEGCTIFQAYDTLRYKVATNTANIAPGLPNVISCGFFGWFEPAIEAPKT